MLTNETEYLISPSATELNPHEATDFPPRGSRY